LFEEYQGDAAYSSVEATGEGQPQQKLTRSTGRSGKKGDYCARRGGKQKKKKYLGQELQGERGFLGRQAGVNGLPIYKSGMEKKKLHLGTEKPRWAKETKQLTDLQKEEEERNINRPGQQQERALANIIPGTPIQGRGKKILASKKTTINAGQTHCPLNEGRKQRTQDRPEGWSQKTTERAKTGLTQGRWGDRSQSHPVTTQLLQKNWTDKGRIQE